MQSGQTFEYDPGGSRWGYGTLGNWASVTSSTIAYDPQIPDPFDDASAEVEARGHNSANELAAVDPGGQNERLFGYDDAGNLVLWERPGGVERALVYDAWNRLVRVADDDGQGEVVLGEYRYNAAHWRVEKIEPSPGGTGVLATRFVYDASWRPILEESIDDYDEQTADWEQAARARNVWGLRYIDEVLARAWGPESDEESDDERFTDILHYVSDPQFSVVAVLDRDGLPVERVRYDAYGKARHSPLGDITGDGIVGPDDSEAIADLLASGAPALGDAEYEVEADFNLDGVLDDTDAATVFEADPTPPLAPGRISALGNPFGYTGAYFDAATGMYLMRHRHYSPELGRWAQRDPAGYVDGKNLYEYVGGLPTARQDPTGLHWDFDPKPTPIETRPVPPLDERRHVNPEDGITYITHGRNDSKWTLSANVEVLSNQPGCCTLSISGGLTDRWYYADSREARNEELRELRIEERYWNDLAKGVESWKDLTGRPAPCDLIMEAAHLLRLGSGWNEHRALETIFEMDVKLRPDDPMYKWNLDYSRAMRELYQSQFKRSKDHFMDLAQQYRDGERNNPCNQCDDEEKSANAV